MRRTLITASAVGGALALAGCGTATSSQTGAHTSAAPKASTRAAKAKAPPAANDGSTPGQAISFGRTVEVSGWKVRVLSVKPEASEPFVHTRPPAGYLYEIYTIRATRTGATPESPIDLNPVLVGPTKDQRGAGTTPSCIGGTPYNDQVDQGGTVRDSACISIPTDDVKGLTLGVGLVGQTWFATARE